MKAILVMEMPNSCDKCEVRCDGYTAKEYAEKGIKKPSWCPLKTMPEKKPDKGYWHDDEFSEGYRDGWNFCIDEILGETE